MNFRFAVFALLTYAELGQGFLDLFGTSSTMQYSSKAECQGRGSIPCEILNPCNGAICVEAPQAECRVCEKLECKTEFWLNGREVCTTTGTTTQALDQSSSTTSAPSSGSNSQTTLDPFLEAALALFSPNTNNNPASSNVVCPGGVTPNNCLQRPCDVKKCDMYPSATCTDDYCGGCNVIYSFNGADITSLCNLDTGSSSNAGSATTTISSPSTVSDVTSPSPALNPIPGSGLNPSSGSQGGPCQRTCAQLLCQVYTCNNVPCTRCIPKGNCNQCANSASACSGCYATYADMYGRDTTRQCNPYSRQAAVPSFMCLIFSPMAFMMPEMFGGALSMFGLGGA